MTISQEELDRVKIQCRSGIADPAACEDIMYVWSLPKLRHAGSTDDEGIEGVPINSQQKIDRVIQEAEDANTKMKRLHGAPYPFNLGPEPAYWSWKALFSYFAYRLEVLTFWCNRYYETRCTVSIIPLGERQVGVLN